MTDLIEYYGDGCSHCVTMAPLVERMKEELGVDVEMIEVWNSEENAMKMQEEDSIDCGGVPFFVNRKSGKQHCGEMSYEELISWAKGE